MKKKTSRSISFSRTMLLGAMTLSLAACGGPPASDTVERESEVAIGGGIDLGSVPSVSLGYVASSLPFRPVGISDSGVILGDLNGAAVASVNGVVSALPLPPGLGPGSGADAITSGGAAVGHSGGVGVVWSITPACPSGACSPPIAIVGPNGGQVAPLGINNAFEVVGAFIDTNPQDSQEHAFRWTPQSGFEDITPTGYDIAEADDVNDAGYIVGFAARSVMPNEALRWTPGSPSVATSLGTGQAIRIRNNGDAIGTIGAPPSPRLWTLAGQVYPLPGPSPSSVEDFADSGRVVGYAGTLQQPWTVYQGTTTSLPWTAAPGSFPPIPTGVNDCGTIVGQQSFSDNRDSGLVWSKSACDPVSDPLVFQLSVSRSGSGTVTSRPAGISCGPTSTACSMKYLEGTTVTLTATPTGNVGKRLLWLFDHWEGACANSGGACTLTMNAAKTAKAVFVLDTP